MKLYSYWQSSTSYRVRIALNLKGMPYETLPVDLRTGKQGTRRHQDLNPGRGVPVLVTGEGAVLTQSMAILEWLEETYPRPALLPAGVLARVRAAAMRIASDIHPVNNLRVIAHLNAMGHGWDEVVAWMVRWMQEGLAAFQRLIERDSAFCFGDAPGVVDLCLVPLKPAVLPFRPLAPRGPCGKRMPARKDLI